MDKRWLALYENNLEAKSTIEKRTLTDLLNDTTKKHGTNTAITFYGQTWSYQELQKYSEALAGALHQDQFDKGDRLAIMLPNCPHYLFSLFGTFRAGGVVVQVNPMYVARELEYILNDSEATHIVILSDLYPLFKSVRNKVLTKKAVVVALKPDAEVELEGDDIMFDSYLKGASAPAPQHSLDPEVDLAVLQYTGGTTGVSKGVMLTHMNLISNTEQTYDFMFSGDVSPPHNAKVVNVLPLFHIFSLTCCNFVTIRHGGNQILIPRFDMPEVLETIKREKPFQFGGVPTMYVGFNQVGKYKEFGLDLVESYVSGGSSLPVEALEAFEEGTGRKLCEGYGLSEAAPVTHFNPSFQERKAGSVGIPLPNTDAKVVAETDAGWEEVGVGEVGEMIIKGPQVMKGYWRKPEETKKTLRDGWLFTGDLAKMDEEGYFSIVDRKKDMILASGYNVYPREIEEVLYGHSGVQEVIVLGLPDPYRGETVKAYITPKPVSTLTSQEIIEFCRKHMAAYKVPTAVEFRDELPKSAVGKLLKRKLRDEELAKVKAEQSS
ncbi:long-chain fatty acid--CoA ligase [Alkalihalophilus marmarensis]|jgi:long-chain acyl-CoA synthetase|uniref:Long-chain fatty acid--CoA ligase n=1 Tax=Alkalihalophilus marmarensis DSM 21297 TaxID=1188261 RepID=U6STM3_9BACI|nr:long-chain fatty acid--CoA ligase [Alkalihalophilus marmarensis]ERN54732.1 long-chain fatty acid--CoA ligase [Alkalihalophilus marmarensis DSM 21297]MCM3488647.1 long-chain fatty acid--CoA ligase [Alkalihalophilus marmarensis]